MTVVSNTVTADTTFNGSATNDRNYAIGDDIIGVVNAGVMVGGFGLRLETIAVNGDIAMTNNGGIAVTHATTGVRLAGNGGSVTYGGTGFITNHSNVFNSPALQITNNGAGSVSATVNNNITANNGRAVDITAANGPITLTQAAGTTISNTLDGEYNGIVLSSTSGNILANLNGTIFTGLRGLTASSVTGDVNINVNGTISANNSGIYASIGNAAATGDIAVTANGTISGDIGFGIFVFNVGTGTTTITVNGTVAGFGGVVDSGGATTVTNNGSITGTGGTAVFLGGGNDTYNGVAGLVTGLVEGGAGNDTLRSGAGKNTLDGGDDNDTLDGGIGADTMIGGAGNDTFIVDNIGDKVFEANGSGTDTVRTTVSFSVASQFVENMVLLGTGSISAVGNNLANTITGNAGNNAIDGRGGIDVMQGGLGNDTYYVDNVLDKTIEANVVGIDTVYTTVSKAFVDQSVEVIRLSGSNNINTTGNSLANTIVGNGANNGINGREGADTLTGGYGNDSFVFNTVLGAGNIDTITDFKPADDTIQLDDAIFTSLGLGVLSANAFRSNSTGLAQDADDRIIYNSANGQIYYDSNGNGAGGNVLFADLNNGLAVTNADFLVV